MNKNDFLKKMNDPNVYLHITKDLNHKGQFKTRVPENRLIGWTEDDKTPRICVGETLNGCLTATGIDRETLVKVFFIDIEKLKLTDSIITWEHLYQNNLVTDAVYTKEAWLTKDFSVPKEDSVIISLDYIQDDEDPYLVEYEIQKEADELGMDAVDLYEEKFDDLPRCISYLKVGDDFSIFDESLYSNIWKTTHMIEQEENCLMHPTFEEYDYEDERNILKSLKFKYDIRFLGEGNGRKVFSFNNYVVKLPKTEDGEMQSQVEYNTYAKAKDTLSILNPSYNILYDDLVFQPLLYKINVDECNKYSSIIDYLKDNNFEEDYIKLVEDEISILVNEYGILASDILKMSSWGVKDDYDDKVYLLDYGANQEVFEKYYM